MTLNIKQPVEDQDPSKHGRNEEPEVDGPEVEGHAFRGPMEKKLGPEKKMDIER